jgi:hypothetical protein
MDSVKGGGRCWIVNEVRVDGIGGIDEPVVARVGGDVGTPSEDVGLVDRDAEGGFEIVVGTGPERDEIGRLE